MNNLKTFKKAFAACKLCEDRLPLGPLPIFRLHEKASILLISQAPGSVAHRKAVPWQDTGGRQLRRWLGIDETYFYSTPDFAVLAMGACYPGRGKGGDLPPMPECAPNWHGEAMALMPGIKLRVLIGQYAQKYYLGARCKRTVTETVRQYAEYLPLYFPIVHPSPRNGIWLAKNPWFENEVVPVLQKRVADIISPAPAAP